MPTDPTGMIAEITKILVSGLVGLLFGLLSAKLLEKRKIISLGKSHRSLLKLQGAEKKLVVQADRSLLTGVESDQGTLEKIPSADSHFVEVVNKGNQETEDLKIEVSLNENAKIIDSFVDVNGAEVKSSGVYANARNSFFVEVLYLNSRDTMRIHLVSAFNQSPEYCDVRVYGKGVVIESAYSKALNVFIFVIGAFLWTFVLGLIFAQPEVVAYSPDFFAFLGGK